MIYEIEVYTSPGVIKKYYTEQEMHPSADDIVKKWKEKHLSTLFVYVDMTRVDQYSYPILRNIKEVRNTL